MEEWSQQQHTTSVSSLEQAQQLQQSRAVEQEGPLPCASPQQPWAWLPAQQASASPPPQPQLEHPSQPSELQPSPPQLSQPEQQSQSQSQLSHSTEARAAGTAPARAAAPNHHPQRQRSDPAVGARRGRRQVPGSGPSSRSCARSRSSCRRSSGSVFPNGRRHNASFAWRKAPRSRLASSGSLVRQRSRALNEPRARSRSRSFQTSHR